MKIKMLRDTVADGRPVFAGKVEEVSDRDAKYLVSIGKALFVNEVDKPADDGVLRVNDTKPAPKGKKAAKKAAEEEF